MGQARPVLEPALRLCNVYLVITIVKNREKLNRNQEKKKWRKRS